MSEPIDSFALYKRVCDIWAEANAVDTAIGRPDVLMAKLTALRDELGSVRAGYICPPAASEQDEKKGGEQAGSTPDETLREALCYRWVRDNRFARCGYWSPEDMDKRVMAEVRALATPTKPEMQPEGLVSSCRALSEAAGEPARKSEGSAT